MLHRRLPSPSSFSLHRIAAAMSSHPPFHVSSSARRRFSSDRRESAAAAAVSGDSHFQSVHNANNHYRNNNHNNNDYRRVYYSYDNHNQNNSSNGNNMNRNYQQYRGPTRGGFNGGTNRNQFAPRPKPADYRNWEFAKLPTHQNSERFVILSYNILADYLANNHRALYWHIPRRFMSWDWRKRNILFELGLWSADIMCFQEVDRFHELEEELKLRGYSGIWKMRTGDPIDGCAVFWRTSRFKLLYEECIEFNKLGMRDNVAQVCVLESQVQNQTSKLLGSSEGSNRVVVCNIHVLYNPRRGEIKLGQVRVLLERAQAVSKKWDDAPVVLCGDFNCVPKSPLYDFISEQKLDISAIDRDKVSGQATAEILPTPREFGHQEKRPSADSMASQASPTTNQDNSVDRKQNDSPEKLNLSGLSEGNSQSQLSTDESVQNVSDKFSNESFNSNSVSCSESFEIDTGDRRSNLGGSTASRAQTSEEKSNEMNTSLAFEKLDEKLAGMSLGESNETLEDTEGLGEDAEKMSDELNEEGDGFPSNPGLEDLLSCTSESEAVDVDEPAYDPSRWTPMEIATATGNMSNTVLEHSLKLKSTYTEVEDRSGTRDSIGEPLVTSYNSRFMGTVDYIWRSEGLCTVKALAPIPKNTMQQSGGFPTKKWGSDHIALATELAFTK